MLNTTIAAVSTPRGKGGIAVIRISGTDAFAVAGAMFKPKSGDSSVTSHPMRKAVFGSILDESGQVCDEGICTLFKGPGSFTGEDMAEISCHGGLSVTEAVYLSAIAHGASAAGPGEFTRRAFINGKLDLTEAEAVGKLIDADTRERMQLAGSALRGSVSGEIASISASLLDTMTALYAAIDYPEEDVGDEGEREIGNTLRTALGRVEKLISTYRTGRAISDGVKCVICGRPNVGKSSVFNLITGEDSAIVTSVAGTTRDILRETVSFGGITLRLSDTAGIHATDDLVEKIGIDRASAEIAKSELVISVFDGGERLRDEDRTLIRLVKSTDVPKIAVINKSDLCIALTEEELELIRESSDSCVTISAQRNGEEDRRALSDAVAVQFGSDKISLSADAVIWDVRQREILSHAKSALRAAVEGLEYGAPIDAVCTCAEEALAALNETDGRNMEMTIVDEIFKRFCVGK
ncbi:MAG: tRNA uridine-5-carboxymethylaminomethyl(34) synthesis GTPase MnmE [Clostridia bacterium]|nr:tRNA uridine-5-carboxymethylaminomethyl(34) synthesis GTPase MnmE [Clostridia bacterium]